MPYGAGFKSAPPMVALKSSSRELGGKHAWPGVHFGEVAVAATAALAHSAVAISAEVEIMVDGVGDELESWCETVE